MKLKALAVTVAAALALCGCNNSTTKTNGKDAFEDLDSIASINSVSEITIDIDMDIPGKMGLQGALSVKGNDTCAQLELTDVNLKVYSSKSNSSPFEVPNLTALIDTTSKELFLSKDSMKGLMKTLGIDVEVKCDANWISLDPEDLGLEIDLAAVSDMSSMSKYLQEVAMPKLKEILDPVKTDILSADKHAIVVNSSSAATIVDALLAMFEDGSAQELYDKAVDMGVTTSEQTMVDVESVLEDAKDILADMPDTDSITIKPTVVGADGSRTATLAVDATVTSSKVVVTLTLKEGTSDLSVPTNTMTYEDYQAALREAYQAVEGA